MSIHLTMPRSRNSRSSSPKKNVSNGNSVDIQKRQTLESVKEIFMGHFDDTQIERALEECNWRGNANTFKN